jgi:hypothetical protein
MRTFICVILVIIAGALPSIIGGWNCWDSWQWWAIAIPIDLLALYIYNSEDKSK